MAKPLQSASIAAPGFYGLNTQESSVTLAAGFALQADNCVIDKFGRLGARKGWTRLVEGVQQKVSITYTYLYDGTHTYHTYTVTHPNHGFTVGDTAKTFMYIPDPYYFALGDFDIIDENSYRFVEGVPFEQPPRIADGTVMEGTCEFYTYEKTEQSTLGDLDVLPNFDITGAHRFLDIKGTEYFGLWGTTGFYIYDGSSLLKNVTYDGSNVIEEANWQAATLNDAAYLFQRGYEPIYFNPTTGVLTGVTDATNSATVTITNTDTVTITNTTTVVATHSGTIASIEHVDHRLETGDSVVISGANETEYNGTFTITVLDDNTYEYTMPSSPSGDATGTVEANTAIAIVTNASHGLVNNDVVLISGANEVGYNGEHDVRILSSSQYYYKMTSIPTSDATGVVNESVDKAVVSHTGHRFQTGQEIVISGATPSDYNDTFEIVVIDYNTYYFTLPSIVNQNPTGTITATWDKGTPPQGNTVLSAYGRLFVADTVENKTTVYWSTLLDGTDWQGGTAGSIDLTSVLINGNDDIVALGAINGRLIIFCRKNIVIYGDDSGTSLDPANMKLVEVIAGVGCCSRDTIQNTGVDILFLSDDGLRSLGRTIQEKSQPMRDLSKNIRDELVRSVHQHNKNTIKSVYSPDNAFYLLLLPEFQRIYCFDMRSPLQDGSARVTIWDNIVHNNMMSGPDDLYFTSDAGLSKYYGYLDHVNTYDIKYYTNYFDFDDATSLKFLKRLGITLIGGSGQTVKLKVGYDYSDSYSTFVADIATQENAEYGVAEYGTTYEYTVGTLSDTVRAPIGGQGNVLQVGFESTIDGSELSVQKLDIYVKTGRTY